MECRPGNGKLSCRCAKAECRHRFNAIRLFESFNKEQRGLPGLCRNMFELSNFNRINGKGSGGLSFSVLHARSLSQAHEETGI